MDVYCDHSATTPLDPRVEEAMQPFVRERFGNPSSPHEAGRRAREALEQARRTLARAIGAQPHETLFTSSATEANNLAVWGHLAARAKADAHLVVSCIEHPCVVEACEGIARFRGDCSVSVVRCGEDGVIRVADILDAIRSETVLVALMHVNNETGMIQPVEELGRALRGRGIAFLCDAVQSLGRIPFFVDDIGCDFASLSSHKVYGPMGVGALYVRSGTPLQPMLVGGGQEGGLRSGTENVPGIVGFARAVELAVREQTGRRLHRVQCEREFLSVLEPSGIDWRLNGAAEPRAPGVLNLSFPGHRSNELAARLDEEGIAVSTGAACSSRTCESSPVLAAMGLDRFRAGSALRFSFGMCNTVQQARWTAERVVEVVRRSGRR
jgi:cysteine desulfurase